MNQLFINRQIEEIILRECRYAPIISVTGPRQSGKTTLVKHLFPGYSYYNFELPLVRNEFLSDPLGFLNKAISGIIIDEFQNVPELLSYIQYVSDENEIPGRFILTGSQNFVMMERISQSLAGRTSLFTLLPFSIYELKETMFSMEETNSNLYRGFYPRVVVNNDNPNKWYNNYINLYIERDVRQIINVKDLDPYSVFLRLLSSRLGQIVNISSLAKQVGRDIKTINSWLRVLEISNIVFLLKPYYNNLNKRIIKSPKLYFYDTGLVSSLLNISSPEQIDNHMLKDNLFENFVISEIAKSINNNDIKCRMYFWNERNRKEIDLLLDFGDRIKLIEIKSARLINDESKDYFYDFSTITDIPVTGKYIIYNGDTKIDRDKTIFLNWKNLSEIFT